MELKVYGSEVYDRGRWWYIIFSFIVILLVLFSIFAKNYMGAILILFFVGGYIVYSLQAQKKTYMIIEQNGLRIQESFFPWGEISGFVVEYHKKSQQISNIVVLTNQPHIYSIADNSENIQNFVSQLSQIIPLLGNYNQTFIELLTRRLKI